MTSQSFHLFLYGSHRPTNRPPHICSNRPHLVLVVWRDRTIRTHTRTLDKLVLTTISSIHTATWSEQHNDIAERQRTTQRHCRTVQFNSVTRQQNRCDTTTYKLTTTNTFQLPGYKTTGYLRTIHFIKVSDATLIRFTSSAFHKVQWWHFSCVVRFITVHVNIPPDSVYQK